MAVLEDLVSKIDALANAVGAAMKNVQESSSGGGTSVTAGDGITVTDGTVAVNNTVVRTTGDQTISGSKRFASQILIGDTTTTVYTGVQDVRKCVNDGSTVNATGLFTNSDGRSKFVHRRGSESADDDAYLVFDAQGLHFSKSGTKGTKTTTEYEVWHAGNFTPSNYYTKTEIDALLVDGDSKSY